jgi:hypothetical protein
MTYRGLSKTVLAIVEVEFLIDNISQLGAGRSLPRTVEDAKRSSWREDAKRSSWRGAADCNSRRVDPRFSGSEMPSILGDPLLFRVEDAKCSSWRGYRREDPKLARRRGPSA